jgi:capsular exopolysaccharide synthesis family protein
MDEQINKTNKSELWNLSVRDIFYKYVRFLPLFLLSLAFALLIAWIYLRYATRIYGAFGTMLINNEQTSRANDKVEDILIGGNKSQNIQNEIEILKSKPLMERVVKSLDLQVTYTAIGKIKEFNVYKQGPFLVEAFEIADSNRAFSVKIKFLNDRQFRINNESTIREFNQVFESPNGVFRIVKNGTPSAGNEYSFVWQPVDAVAGALAGGVRVQPKTPGTGILAVSFQTTNGQMAADIVNGLMIQYDSMTVEQNNFSTDQMLGFIDSRLGILDKELDTLQLRYLEYRQRYNLIDIEAQSTNSFNKISESDKIILEKQARMMLADDISDYLQNKKNQFNVAVPSALGLEDATLNEMIGAYNTAQLKRQLLLDANVPPSNPTVVETDGQIEKIRQSVLENLKNIRSSLQASINSMERRSNVEETHLQGMPFILKGKEEMERQINTKMALYNLLQGKREEAAIGRASTISNSKIIDKAVGSNMPVKPNKRAIQILAVLIGLGLPAIIIFIGEVVNDKVTTRFDIEKITDAPILGEVGHSYSDKTMIVNRTSRSMVAEQFRIIRSNLQYILPKEGTQTILVTSSFSGEGKSFVSTNMGAVLALTGKKTVILEFDIRKPKVLSGLGMSKKSGISNYLVGKAEIKDLIIQVPEHENLFVLPCGPIPPNPSELLLDARVNEMFAWLRSEFVVIIVDTAPVGMVSDAMTLGKFTDCTLYLVRQGHTFKKQVALIDEFYREKKLPKVSIIINDVKVKPGYGYYGYGRYGYGYGYGQKSNYYEEETPPEGFLEKWLRRFDFRNWFKKKK